VTELRTTSCATPRARWKPEVVGTDAPRAQRRRSDQPAGFATTAEQCGAGRYNRCVSSEPRAAVKSAFEHMLRAMLVKDPESDRLWRALREFVGRHKVELFQRAQENGLHLLPVHMYSPVPDTRRLSDLDYRRRDDFLRSCGFDVEQQLAFLASLTPWARETDDVPGEAPAPDGFHWTNTFFGPLDALTYYGVIRELRPHKVVEVGGGYSTMLAARAVVLNGLTELVCVDPAPANALSGLRGLSRVLPVPVQRLPPEFFDDLGSGDILFVDSTHVSKLGSDVNFIVLDVLPRLRDGVLVHFHDVFLPDEYPRAWIEGLAFLNEQYLLAAFLLFNARFELLALNHHLWSTQREAVEAVFGRAFPPEPRVKPSSLWMRKVADP
jgi:hypothetical protein